MAVSDRKPPFRFSHTVRVGFDETDAQGVVYYGRYMPYFDYARTEYHRHLGRPAIEDAEFVMRALQVEYHAPARFDDLLECFVRVSRIGRSSMTYEFAAYRVEDELLMVTATQTLVRPSRSTRTKHSRRSSNRAGAWYSTSEARITNSAPSRRRLPRCRWYSVRAWSKYGR